MRTFVYKLYRSKKNKHLHQIIDISGIIYNYCISMRRRYYRLFGETVSANRLKVHITKVKKQRCKDFWSIVGSQAVQDIVERVDRAYNLFFDCLKRKVRCSPPRFRKVKRYKSFTLKQSWYSIFPDNRVRIGNVVYKYSKSRDIEGEIKTVTVKRNSLGEVFLHIVSDTDQTSIAVSRTGKMAGCDFGLKTYLTLYNGESTEEITSPQFYKASIDKIRRAGRKLSRKHKGSNNRKKAKADLFRQHRRIANQRKDHHFKLALDLVRKYDVLAFEDLNMKAMQMLWGRKISDLGFSGFLKILEHQASKNRTKIVYAGRFYPSSKTCSNCGYVLEILRLSERTWKCPECGAEHSRDENAAINLYRVGASTHGVETVSLDFAS